MTIRSRLLLLVLSVLVPAMLGVAWLIAHSYAAERDAHARALAETTRALSQLVDSEIGRRATVARLLAQSRWLDDATLPGDNRLRFEQQARRALQQEFGGWIELRSRAGALLLDTRLADGTMPAPDSGIAREWQDQPLLLPLAMSATGTATDVHAAWVEPVRREGRTLFDLVVTLRASELQRIVDGQRLPQDWVGTVIDSRNTVVARHPGGAGYAGRAGTADLVPLLQPGREGLFESVTLDGVRTTAFHSTSARGWSFVIGMPRDQFAGRLPAVVRETGLAALALLLLALAAALWLARRIALPVQALKESAARMQAGLPVCAPAPGAGTGIVECDEVAAALAEASVVLQHTQDDLQRRVAQAVERTRLAEQRISDSQRMEAMGRLTGGLAHDVNNLLGVISNSAHLIARHRAASELQVPLAATLRAVDGGSRLMQHLLRFAGRHPLRPQRVDLARMLPELQPALGSVVGRHIEISVQIAPGTAAVFVDPAELELSLLNLALNARDAMQRGGELRLRVRNAGADEHGASGAIKGGRYVLITVGDDGVGMDVESTQRAFEPFYTTQAPGQGSGLGLSQVHGFCIQAGGYARLDSTPGIGTTVSLLLPACLDSADDEALPLPAASIAGARVLLVEDNVELGDVTAALLQSHDAQVQRAANAEEALQLLERQPPFDVVLSDVVMPGRLDGLQLARQLRSERPALPVVLVSGYNRADTAGDVTSDFAVLRKPCPPDVLLGALHDAMAARVGA